MNRIKCVRKNEIQSNKEKGWTVIDVTSSAEPNSIFRYLSPFFLQSQDIMINGVKPRIENLWQYGKMYPEMEPGTKYGDGECDTFTVNLPGNKTEKITLRRITPSTAYQSWRYEGLQQHRANRYPKGRGKRPMYSVYYHEGQAYMMDYIQYRKMVYLPQYGLSAEKTEAYSHLKEILDRGENLAMVDYDICNLNKGYDAILNDSSRIMGHSAVLAMCLNGDYEPALPKKAVTM